jgi:BT1 family
MVTIVIDAFASVFDWIVIKRWNITILGIPDKLFFMFGNTITGSIVNSLQFIPLNAIYSKMAPEGMESAVVGEMIFYTH